MKRLNFKLTFWLLGITLISIVGVHFLHGYQLDRNADFLRLQAEQARKDGKPKEAIKQYNQYLRHRDDPEGYSALSELVVEVAKDPEATRRDRFQAYTILEEAIRRHPDLHDVRRRLIDYTMQMRRFPETIDHIQYLFEHDQKDPELDLKIAICNFANGDEPKALKKLYELLGYDEAAGTFSEAQPSGAHEVAAFEFLATLLRRKPDGAERSDAVMKQLVAWNPESAKAHLARGVFLVNSAQDANRSPALKEKGEADFKEAKVELDRAIELEAKNVDILLALAVYAMTVKDYDDAGKRLEEAMAISPERHDIYLRGAQLYLLQEKSDLAAEQLKLGLTKANDKGALLERLIELQFQLNDLAGVRESRKQMAELGTFPPDLIRFIDGHLKYAENDFFEAAKEFEAVRPGIARITTASYAYQLDVMLSRCYEMLGMPDQQLEVCQRILNAAPGQLSARLGVAVALQNLGRHAEAHESVVALLPVAKNAASLRAPLLNLLVNEEQQKPESARDWTEIDKIAEMMYADESRPPIDNVLLKADLLMARNQADEAEKLLTTACKEHPKEVKAWLTLLRCLGRNDKVDKVVPILTVAEKRAGDSPQFRVERARLAVREGGDGVVEKLQQLEKNQDAFSDAERTGFMMQMGTMYGAAQNYANAKRCWKYVAEQEPRNFAVRRLLLELAQDNKDEAGIAELRKEVRDSKYFGPQSAVYKFFDASWKLSRIAARREGKTVPLDETDRKEIADALREVDEAIEVRKQWYALWRIRGELEQMQAADPTLSPQDKIARIDGAIKSLQKSLTISRNNQVPTARRLVMLLHARNRIPEAATALQYLPANEVAGDKMNTIIEDIKQKQGDVDGAIELAQKDVEKDPKNAALQLWLGQLLDRAGRTEESEAAYRKATEANPEFPQPWEYLVRRLAVSQKKAEAIAAAEQGAKSLSKDLPAQGRLFELAGEPNRAEELYSANLTEKPDDVAALRSMIDFYYNSGQALKAAPHIDHLIEVAKKSSEEADKSHLATARRLKAELLASARDYNSVLQARALIEQNATNGQLAPADMQVLVKMLSGRPEPDSRAKALELLEGARKERELSPREQMLLAQLYDRADKWQQAREIMRTAIVQKGSDPEVLFSFVQMLMRHDEYDEATPLVDRLEEYLEPKSTIIIGDALKAQIRVLRARQLVHAGDKEKAADLLGTLVPSRPIPVPQLRVLEDVAKIMEEFGLLESAEKLLNEYVSSAPGPGSVALAGFVGRRDDVDRCFQLLNQARASESATTIVPIGLDTLRRLPAEATKERFQLLLDWLKEAEELETKQVPQIRMIVAELYDAQGRYADAIKLYREVLENPATTMLQKAITYNNLAFLLAIAKDQGGNAVESVKMADEAMKILGPTSDLLDTRALGYLAQGKVEQALTDLRLAAADAPTNGKFFHLAYAEKQAKNLPAARDAIAKAKEAGIETAWLTPLERQMYTQLAQELQ